MGIAKEIYVNRNLSVEKETARKILPFNIKKEVFEKIKVKKL